ncbi:hypothetical protein [Caudoviricetes sp.]|nr:hypothetical protein [Caudoviricetes sp.]
MKLKLTPEGHAVVKDGKPVYVHDDGTEVAFDAPGTVATITRLNHEAKGHRERAEAAEAALKPFEGIEDATKARKALELVANLDAKKLVDAGERDKAIEQAIKAVEDKFAPVIKENQTLSAQLHAHMVGGAFSRSKYIAEKFATEGPAGVEIAQALFGKQLKVEDGKVVAYDANGSKIYSRARPGELADTEEAIEILVESHPHKAHLVKGSGATGGGAQNNGGGGGGAAKGKIDGTAAERTEYFKSKFPELSQ